MLVLIFVMSKTKIKLIIRWYMETSGPSSQFEAQCRQECVTEYIYNTVAKRIANY
jgi:hypothetical protein